MKTRVKKGPHQLVKISRFFKLSRFKRNGWWQSRRARKLASNIAMFLNHLDKQKQLMGAKCSSWSSLLLDLKIYLETLSILLYENAAAYNLSFTTTVVIQTYGLYIFPVLCQFQNENKSHLFYNHHHQNKGGTNNCNIRIAVKMVPCLDEVRNFP